MKARSLCSYQTTIAHRPTRSDFGDWSPEAYPGVAHWQRGLVQHPAQAAAADDARHAVAARTRPHSAPDSDSGECRESQSPQWTRSTWSGPSRTRLMGLWWNQGRNHRAPPPARRSAGLDWIPVDWDDFIAQLPPTGDWESPFEEAFARSVLPLTGLDPGTVEIQTPLTDFRGRRRRIDFTITEPPRLRIALEVDGYDKTGAGRGMTRSEFVDWLERQNALLVSGWRVLRFPNSIVTHNPDRCAREIDLTVDSERAIARALERTAPGSEQGGEQGDGNAAIELAQNLSLEAERRLADALRSKASAREQQGLRQELEHTRAHLHEIASRLIDQGEERERAALQRERESLLIEANEDLQRRVDLLDRSKRSLSHEVSTMKVMSWALSVMALSVVALFGMSTCKGPAPGAADRDGAGAERAKATTSGRSTAQLPPQGRTSSSPKRNQPSPELGPSTANPSKPSARTPAKFVASSLGRVYHVPTCGWAKRIKPTNKLSFDGTAAAGGAGFRPCRVCLEDPSQESTLPVVSWSDARSVLGRLAVVHGPIRGTKYASRSKGAPTFLNLGAAYPSSGRVELVIWGQDRGEFPGAPETIYKDRHVAVIGVVEERDGVLRIEIDGPDQIQSE